MFYIVAKDCEVGPWSLWSEADAQGIRMRTRHVIHQACGGGKQCPPLIETENGKNG